MITRSRPASRGLGLDISRRIAVDRHGGEINFESGSNETVARVRIPIRR
jgi:nitrogen-specific signal transduction histidine kinase